MLVVVVKHLKSFFPTKQKLWEQQLRKQQLTSQQQQQQQQQQCSALLITKNKKVKELNLFVIENRKK